MLYTIVDTNLIFSDTNFAKQCKFSSSNPFDYIRNGYQLDNAKLFGGQNNVNYNINHTGDIADNKLYSSNK